MGDDNNQDQQGNGYNDQGDDMLTDDDDDDVEDIDLAEFESEAVDPGSYTIYATIGICLIIGALPLLYFACRRRRKERKFLKTIKKTGTAPSPPIPPDGDDESVLSTSTDKTQEDFLGKDVTFIKRRSESKRMRATWQDILKDEGNELNILSRRLTFGKSADQMPKTSKNELLKPDDHEKGGVLDELSSKLSIPETARSNWIPEQAEEQTSKSKRELVREATSNYDLMDSDVAESPQYGFDHTMRYLQALFRCDREMTRIMKLAIPYTFSAVSELILDLTSMGLIGKLMGTRALAASIMVDYIVSIGTMILDGLLSTLGTVCSQAIGAGNHELAGQYVQIAFVLYLAGYVPQIILWWFYVEPIVLWFEFDEETAAIAKSYAKVYLFAGITEIADSSLTYLLEVSGYEKFTTFFGLLHHICEVIGVFVVVVYGPNTLQMVALVSMGIDVMALIIKLYYIRRKRWYRLYWYGIFRNIAFENTHAVSVFLQSGIPIAIGYVLSYGEWEVLFFLAGYMGAAEVAAWGVMGEFWGGLESLTSSWADAAEVRVSQLLGGGKARAGLARLSAHKSMVLGMVSSIVASLGLLLVYKDLPAWITDDESIQTTVSDLLPLIALGNMTLALGSISYQLIGAQGRYKLATFIQFVGSWIVTLPLSVVATVYMGWNLKGLVASVVIGYMVSGTLNFVFLMDTDWEARAGKVQSKNQEEESDEESSSDEEDDDEKDDAKPVPKKQSGLYKARVKQNIEIELQ